jgi:Protein of unknown function (DUF3352)
LVRSDESNGNQIMKRKSFFGKVAIAAIIIAILSLVALISVRNLNPQDRLAQNIQPQAAQFLPSRSPLVTSFVVNPERLILAAKLATKVSDRRSLSQEITNLKTQLRQTWQLDYDHDLKPWLGSEITFAITTSDLDRNPQNGLQAGYLIALSTEQPEVAKKYLNQFWQKQSQSGADLAFEQYQGVSIISANQSANQKAQPVSANSFGASENLFYSPTILK